MRLIVLADTHSEDLPAAVLEAIRKADMIIHAGDFSELGDYNRLKKLQDIRSV